MYAVSSDWGQPSHDLEIELYSPLAEPSIREWSFPEARIYALLKPVIQVEGLVLVLRWAARFAPKERKPGLVYYDVPMHDETTARRQLLSVSNEDATHYYNQFRHTYSNPASW